MQELRNLAFLNFDGTNVTPMGYGRIICNLPKLRNIKLSSFHPDVFIDNSRNYGQSNTTLFRFFYLVIGDMFRPGLGHHQAFSKNTDHLTVIS